MRAHARRDARIPPSSRGTGRSYERAAIDAWIARHGRDPVATSVKVTREDAAPNRAVRASIERYVARETARRARRDANERERANEDANEDANETDDEEDDEEDETSDGEGEAKESGGTAVNWRARVETATRETATRETATRKVRRYLFPRRRVDVARRLSLS